MSDTPANTADTVVNADVPKPFKVSDFAGTRMYHVKSDTYVKLMPGAKKHRDRFSRYMDASAMLDDIRGYAKANPSAPIMVTDEDSGAMTFLKTSTPSFRRHR